MENTPTRASFLKIDLVGIQIRQCRRNEPENLNLQATGGQCLRLFGINDNLAKYEEVGEGPNVERLKGAVKRL
jgi:hypothetical protein